MRKAIATLFLLLLVGAAGYLALRSLQKPSITVSDIDVREISEESVIVDVRVIIHNPNLISADVSQIDFDVYYFENGDQRYLGHGTKKNVHIRKRGDTTFIVPVVIDNLALVRALSEASQHEEITLRVSGAAYLKLLLFEIEIPFEKTQRVDFESESVRLPTTIPTPTASATQTMPTPSPALISSVTPTPSINPFNSPAKFIYPNFQNKNRRW